MNMDKNFEIEKDTLVKYTGNDEVLIIPEGIKEIGSYAFKNCKCSEVVLPCGVTYIREGGFHGCTNLKKIDLPGSLKVIENQAFEHCVALREILIPEGVQMVGIYAFGCCNALETISIPSTVTTFDLSALYSCRRLKNISFFGYGMKMEYRIELYPREEVFAPNVPLNILYKYGLGIQAVLTFIKRFSEYTDSKIIQEYVYKIVHRKNKYFTEILQTDNSGMMKLLSEYGAINSGNIIDKYLQLAKVREAKKSVAYLKSLDIYQQALNKKHTSSDKKSLGDKKTKALWDGKHFSLDGKKLIKYQNKKDREIYDVPEGTREIGVHAFRKTHLKQIRLPQSVTTIRQYAFETKEGCPLFIKLPSGLKKLPFKSCGPHRYEPRVYYISTDNSDLLPKICFDNFYSVYPVYTGGSINDIDQKWQKFAVMGFIYAWENGLEDMSKWENDYVKHIRRNQKLYAREACEKTDLLMFMLKEKAITKSGMKTLMEYKTQEGDTNCLMELLNYKNANLTEKEDDLGLTINISDSLIKKYREVARRREEIKNQKGIKGIAFVVTGDLDHFGTKDVFGYVHRDDLKRYIEERGGFLRSAVSLKTDYLICNDPNSNSTKIQKAKELNVPIITEKEFLKMAEER